jgi:hypothetical protein
MLRSRLFAFALSLSCAVAGAAPAPAADDASVPNVLKDWRSWVLKDLEYRACPFLATQIPSAADTYVCAWPGRLALDATATGAKFSVHWRVDAPSWIALPGDAQQWPQAVTVNNQRQPVLDHGNAPELWLAPGNYEIAGNIFWHDRPQSLRVPANLGLIALNVDGKTVVPIQREGGEVTLGRSETSAPEADSIDVHVFRKLEDGVPAMLTSQIRLTVSGQAREEILGPVLPAGFDAISLSGDWPARLDNDGRLHVQVQPGDATVIVGARATAPLGVVAARLPEAVWPRQEIWSYAAAPRLRITSPAAALSVDPHQAEVPAEWSALPAFALANDDKLTLEERSRGLAPDEANRLMLRREAWLDFNGDGWFARDYLSGDMVQGWRLDVAAPLTLERAEANASRAHGQSPESLLVTKGVKHQSSGVEWRTPAVDLAGGVRIAAVSSLPASGWQQTFDKIDTTLHFPFGYKLLGAPGADSVEGSWMSRWTLLDVFIAAILVLLAWRLLGVLGALATVGYVVLGYQESGAPFWTLLALLGLALIARVLPAGKLQRVAEWSRRAALLVLVLCALPFLADQVRYGLYPQLENGGIYGAENASGYAGAYRHKFHRTIPIGEPQNEVVAMSTAAAPPPAMAPPPVGGNSTAMKKSEARDAAKPALETITVSGSRIQQSQLIDHYSQSTVVQTGAGEPGWNLGSTAILSWSGPVLPTQNVQLIIAPPWVVRPLRFLLVALLVWLVWRVFRSVPILRIGGGRTAASVAGLLLIASLVTTTVHAQTAPSDQLLQQLRERLSEAPKCAPACASVAQAQIAASGDTLDVVIEVHAGERIAFPLPTVDNTAMLKSVKVDTNADAPIARTADGQSWLALDRGVHRVELDYAAYADKTSLSFTLPPGRVLFEGKGWSASGLQDDRLLTATLTLARARDAAQGKPVFGTQQFAPYVSVQRSLSLGLDWTISTQVQRISPATGGFTLSLPLVPGEHVASTGIKVRNEDGKGATATIGVPDGSDGANWSSTLDKGDTLMLTAPALTDHAEVWRVLVSPTWHVEFSGVPGVGRAADEDVNDYRNFEFHPLPGETLTLKITRPVPTQGAVRAIDAVTLSSESGQRAATGFLSFTLRASQGGEQTITLPKEAEVIAVTRDAEVLNLRAVDGKLSLPVKPGAQRFEIRFRDNTALGWLMRTPSIALGLPAANIDLSLALPADRWLLAASGPAVGPAVLYWGELVVMIVIAFGLARSRRTRLQFHHWLLLGLGFSTFSWFALGVVVVWLFAFDWRSRRAAAASWWRFDLLQIALVGLTIAALFCLVSAIPQGLLGQPDMQVVGNASSAQALNWFADRSADALPQASAISLPLWVYKVLMLAWALWLANALIGWLRDGFAAWTRGGYWKPRTRAIASVEVPVDDVANDAASPQI